MRSTCQKGKVGLDVIAIAKFWQNTQARISHHIITSRAFFKTLSTTTSQPLYETTKYHVQYFTRQLRMGKRLAPNIRLQSNPFHYIDRKKKNDFAITFMKITDLLCLFIDFAALLTLKTPSAKESGMISLATGRFTFQKRHLYFSLMMPTTTSVTPSWRLPRYLQFLSEDGNILEEQELTSNDYLNATGKVLLLPFL